MNDATLPYDVFLNHSAKDKPVLGGVFVHVGAEVALSLVTSSPTGSLVKQVLRTGHTENCCPYAPKTTRKRKVFLELTADSAENADGV